MAITRLNTGAGSSGTSMTASVSAGTDRVLCGFFSSRTGGASWSPAGDYGGQTMTEAATVGASGGAGAAASLFVLNDAGIAAASGTTLSFTGGGHCIGWASYENVGDQVNMFGNTNTATGVSGSGSISCAITIGADNAGVACSTGESSTSGVDGTWGADLTEQFEVFSSSFESKIGGADRLESTGASRTADIEWDDSGGNYDSAALVFIELVASGLDVEQEGFRGRNDDGSETTATWIAAQDTNFSVQSGALFRIRFLINATSDPASTQYQLEMKESSESTWVKVPLE